MLYQPGCQFEQESFEIRLKQNKIILTKGRLG
jgi:hypothetical protein